MKNDKIQQIIDNTNIVEVISDKVKLHRQGKNYFGLCPFHPDNSPSMSVSPEKKMYKCFVCGNAGNVIHFVSEYEKIPFMDAAAQLAKKVGIDFQLKTVAPKYNDVEKKYIDVFAEANTFYQYQLVVNKDASNATKYLKTRLLSNEDCKKYDIGFSPSTGGLTNYLINKGFDKALIENSSLGTIVGETIKDRYLNRLIFGIRNEFGDIVGFSARALDDSKPKYINTSENDVFKKSKLLYNYNIASRYIDKENKVYICEGFMDVIALSKINVNNAIAIMGTSLTNDHLAKLSNRKIILLLDSDDAGIQASLRSIEILKEKVSSIDVVVTDGQKDPAETLEKFGPEALTKMIANVISAEEFAFSKIFKTDTKWDPAKLKDAIYNFKKYVNNKNQLSIDFYSSKIANLIGIPDYSPIKNMLSIQKNTKIHDKTYVEQVSYIPADVRVEENDEKTINTSTVKVVNNAKTIPNYESIKDAEGIIMKAMVENPYDFMKKMYTEKEEFLFFIHKPYADIIKTVIQQYKEKIVKNNNKNDFNSQKILEKIYNNVIIEGDGSSEDEVEEIKKSKNIYEKPKNEQDSLFLDWKIKSLRKLNMNLKSNRDKLPSLEAKSAVTRIVKENENLINALIREKDLIENDKK